MLARPWKRIGDGFANRCRACTWRGYRGYGDCVPGCASESRFAVSAPRQKVMPDLVFAGRDVLRRAEELIPGRVLEVEISKSIRAGRKSRRRWSMPALGADQRYVTLEGGEVIAVVAKSVRPAWRVERLIARRPLGSA